jgi:hypothetical protein
MWGMIIGAAVSVMGSLMDGKNQNDAHSAQEIARRKQNLQAVRQSNAADAGLRLQDKSNFEAARQELENQTLSHVKARSTVTTAMAESGLEGRSMDRVKRDVDNAYLRTKGMINENYSRDYTNIWAQRESNRDSLIAQIEGNPAQPKQGGLTNIIGMGTNAFQGATVGQNLWGMVSDSPLLGGGKAKKSAAK